jgi:hypothetical protein
MATSDMSLGFKVPIGKLLKNHSLFLRQALVEVLLQTTPRSALPRWCR